METARLTAKTPRPPREALVTAIPILRERVRLVMSDGTWRTPYEIRSCMIERWGPAAGGSDSGITAKLRDLRKERFGGWPGRVDSRKASRVTTRNAGEAWEYRLVSPAARDAGPSQNVGEAEGTRATERARAAGGTPVPPPVNRPVLSALPSTIPRHEDGVRTDFKAVLAEIEVEEREKANHGGTDPTAWGEARRKA